MYFVFCDFKPSDIPPRMPLKQSSLTWKQCLKLCTAPWTSTRCGYKSSLSEGRHVCSKRNHIFLKLRMIVNDHTFLVRAPNPQLYSQCSVPVRHACSAPEFRHAQPGRSSHEAVERPRQWLHLLHAVAASCTPQTNTTRMSPLVTVISDLAAQSWGLNIRGI